MTKRIDSIDLVRGLAMILMAIDHVRVYSGVPPGGPAPGVFFTRWVTHFVAPAFAFLAGTAIYLRGGRDLSKYLLTRGVWLVFLELTVIRVAWTFNFDFRDYLLAGVIWMLGICMILMAGIIHLPLRVTAALGIAIIALHNLADFLPRPKHPGALLALLYTGGEAFPPLIVLYVIIPWIGVMMTGYAFGSVMQRSPEERRRFCIRTGVALTGAFVLLRFANVYGDPRPWNHQYGILGFLATTKYPASLQFLLMTLGPMFLAIGLAEHWTGRLARIPTTYGRVPMFYYLLHIPLIHAAACGVSWIREGSVNPWLFTNHPMEPPPVPPGYMWSLGLLYLVYAICVAALYFPCAWYARVRAERRSPLLSYI